MPWVKQYSSTYQIKEDYSILSHFLFYSYIDSQTKFMNAKNKFKFNKLLYYIVTIFSKNNQLLIITTGKIIIFLNTIGTTVTTPFACFFYNHNLLVFF